MRLHEAACEVKKKEGERRAGILQQQHEVTHALSSRSLACACARALSLSLTHTHTQDLAAATVAQQRRLLYTSSKFPGLGFRPSLISRESMQRLSLCLHVYLTRKRDLSRPRAWRERARKAKHMQSLCTDMGLAATEYKPPTYHARWCGYEPL